MDRRGARPAAPGRPARKRGLPAPQLSRARMRTRCSRPRRKAVSPPNSASGHSNSRHSPHDAPTLRRTFGVRLLRDFLGRVRRASRRFDSRTRPLSGAARGGSFRWRARLDPFDGRLRMDFGHPRETTFHRPLGGGVRNGHRRPRARRKLWHAHRRARGFVCLVRAFRCRDKRRRGGRRAGFGAEGHGLFPRLFQRGRLPRSRLRRNFIVRRTAV